MTQHSTSDEKAETKEDARLTSLHGFSEFLKVDTTKEIDEITTTIDGILAKFEEFCTVVESIRLESKDFLFTTLPVLHERCQQLQPIFEQIDVLENFVGTVKKSVDDCEEKVRVAERDLGNRGLKKILNTVPIPVPRFLSLSRSKDVKSPNDVKSPTFEEPRTFKTNDYFSPIGKKVESETESWAGIR